MRCPYCGRENAPGARGCAHCKRAFRPNTARPSAQTAPPSKRQAPKNRQNVRRKKTPKFIRILRYLFTPENAQGAPAQPKRRARPNPKKKWMILAAAVLAVVVILSIVIAASVHNSGSTLESRHIQLFYSKDHGSTSVVFAGKTYETEIVGAVKTVYNSADGNVQAALTESGDLYYMTTQSLTMVSAKVESFVLSADGSVLAYIMDNTPDPETDTETSAENTTARRAATESTEPETTEYTPAGGEQFMTYTDTSLFLYDSVTAKSALIANHVSADSVCVSPNGTAVGYAVTDESGESFEGFIFREDVYVSAGRNTLPIAISDDGTRMYHIKYELMDDCWIMKFFSKNGENEIKLGELADMNRFTAYLNKDCSELIFGISGNNGGFFYCDGKEEKIRLASGYYPLYSFGERAVRDGRMTVTPYATFAKTTFTDAENALQYLDGKMNCFDVGLSGTMFRLSPDGKTVYSVDDKGMLRACNVRKASCKELASHVMNFDLSADGKFIYYLTSDNELYAHNGSKASLLSENVYAKGTGLCVTEGGYLYFLKDYSYGNGTLCYVKGDGKVKVLQEYNNVHDIAADTAGAIYYRANFSSITGAYDLYYGEGKKFSCILKEMN